MHFCIAIGAVRHAHYEAPLAPPCAVALAGMLARDAVFVCHNVNCINRKHRFETVHDLVEHWRDDAYHAAGRAGHEARVEPFLERLVNVPSWAAHRWFRDRVRDLHRHRNAWETASTAIEQKAAQHAMRSVLRIADMMCTRSELAELQRIASTPPSPPGMKMRSDLKPGISFGVGDARPVRKELFA